MNTLSNRRYLITQSAMQSLCLNNNKREKTMNRDLIFTADSDIIQSPVAFQSAKKSLNRCSSIIDSLPFLSFRKQRFLVGWIYLNDWLGFVLAFDEKPQFSAGIASIANNILRTEFTISKPSLTQNTTSNSAIVGRTSRNISSYGKLVLGICQKVKLIAIVEFIFARCINLNSPSSIWVRRRSLGTVRPSFQVSAIKSNAFAEIRQHTVKASGQTSHNILNHDNVFRLRQLTHEARIRKLGWDTLIADYSTSYGQQRVILQGSYEAGEGWKSYHCHGNICFPENFDCIARSASRNFQSSKQSIIRYRPKDSIKLLNNRWGLIQFT